MESKVNVSEKVKFKENLAYAIGGGGINLMATSILGTILVYYTYVVGVSAGVAASVLGLSRVFDGISDVIMGRIVDKTHSKYGKAKPWFIRMLFPMMISVVACFCVPKGWGTMAQAIYMFVTYNLACTVCGTALGVANGALNGFMTLDQASRGLNGAISMITNTITNMVFAALYLKMALFFGNGEQYSPRGWTITILIFSVAYIPLMLISFFGTKERVTLAEMQQPVVEDKKTNNSAVKELSTVESFKTLIKNKYWLITLLVGFMIYFSMSLSSAVLVYFSDYVLGDINLQASLNIFNNIGVLAGVVIAIPIMNKAGKRLPIVAGMFIAIIATVPMLFSRNVTVCIACMAAKGVGMGITVSPMGSFVHDALTYGIWKYKINCTGIGSSAITMATKIGAGLSSFAIGVLLEIGGFISGGGAQPASAITMINAMFLWIPIVLSALIILAMVPYNLDKKYEAITSDLAQGKYAED